MQLVDSWLQQVFKPSQKLYSTLQAIKIMAQIPGQSPQRYTPLQAHHRQSHHVRFQFRSNLQPHLQIRKNSAQFLQSSHIHITDILTTRFNTSIDLKCHISATPSSSYHQTAPRSNWSSYQESVLEHQADQPPSPPQPPQNQSLPNWSPTTRL